MLYTNTSQTSTLESVDRRWKGLYRTGGIAALFQLLCTLATMVVSFTVGVEPTTAEEYYRVLNADRLIGLLRLDFPTLLSVCLFAVTAFVLYAALKREQGMYVAFAMVLALIGVVFGLANHSAFSMIHLSNQYAVATTDAQRTLFLTAGEAVIASDMWHSTAGFIAGIFMQGGFVLISFLMLRSRSFGKVTAYSGMLGNGLDFVHIFVGLAFPTVGIILLSIGGLFYMIWFVFLARDLLRLSKDATVISEGV